MIGVWMTPCKNGQCELSVRRDGINKLVIASKTPLTDAQAEELFWCIGAMQRSGKTLKDLLKEQEPKQVVGIADSVEGMEVGYCPSCDRAIVNKKIDETKFCKFCGQAVKWNE